MNTTSITAPGAPSAGNTSTGPGSLEAAIASASCTDAQIASMNMDQLEQLYNSFVKAEMANYREQADILKRCYYIKKARKRNKRKVKEMKGTLKMVRGEHVKIEEEMQIKQDDLDLAHTLLTRAEVFYPPGDEDEDEEDYSTMIPERAEIYYGMKSLKGDYKQMSESLKEITMLTRVGNKLRARNDPMAQILLILNEHTETLERMNSQLDGYLDDVDNVANRREAARRDRERALRLMTDPR